ncbi:hypothetical protein RSW36_26790, partial [Escherichia coli]|uniref:hypothetical protein n=1 Tax=Escherichia coli TaxID=562 RepID=UPI0028E07C5B
MANAETPPSCFRNPDAQKLDRIKEHENVWSQMDELRLDWSNPAHERGGDAKLMDHFYTDPEILLHS